MRFIRDRLFPTEYVKSIYEYDFERAYSEGKRMVLFDIDNTMVPHGAAADGKSRAFIDKLKANGFYLSAVSNNREPRVKSFCDAVGVPYVYKAGKPGKKGYLEALKKAGFAPCEALFFGDQIFTDIWGANNAGIDSILVKPTDKSTDEIQIRLKRLMERPVVKAYFREKGIAFREYFN